MGAICGATGTVRYGSNRTCWTNRVQVLENYICKKSSDRQFRNEIHRKKLLFRFFPYMREDLYRTFLLIRYGTPI